MKTLLIGLLLASGMAHAAPYHLDPAHMEVGFSVKHLMISNVKGRFDKVTGSMDFDSAKKQIKDVEVTIEASSINTNEPDRDKHLRGADFFDVEKFSKITFKTDKKDKINFDGKKGTIEGTLTIKDKSKKVTLDFTNNGEVDFMGTKKVAFTATTKINRKDFGLTWNKAIETGGVAVGEEVTITIDGEANADKADGKAKK